MWAFCYNCTENWIPEFWIESSFRKYVPDVEKILDADIVSIHLNFGLNDSYISDSDQ